MHTTFSAMSLFISLLVITNMAGYIVCHDNYNSDGTACSTSLKAQILLIGLNLATYPMENDNVESLLRPVQYTLESFNAKVSPHHIHSSLNALKRYQPKPLPYRHSFFLSSSYHSLSITIHLEIRTTRDTLSIVAMNSMYWRNADSPTVPPVVN